MMSKCGLARFFITALICICFMPTLVLAGESMKITVGESVEVGSRGFINTSSLAMSRTGVIIAAVPVTNWPNFTPWQFHTFRISNDGGKTWSQHYEANRAVMGGGATWAALRGGGVLKHSGPGSLAIEGEDGWFSTYVALFPDDLTSFEMESARLYVPDAVLTLQEPSPHIMAGPVFDKGKILQLDNGDLLSPMYGRFKGDKTTRVFLIRSGDRGRTWYYYSTAGYEDKDPNPELPGEFQGFSEPSFELLPNNRMVCIMRAGGWPPEGPLRTMYICWSDDLGKTWTKPEPTNPPDLYSIWPTLQLLDNGVLVCVYGRPGFHTAFSTDEGHTWIEKRTFVKEDTTGMHDMIKIGPNKLLAIGGVGGDGDEGGTRVFPITVDYDGEKTVQKDFSNTKIIGNLKITQSVPMKLGDVGKAEDVSLVMSNTGTVAAFVPTVDWPGYKGKLRQAYRISYDKGQTWTGQFETPSYNINTPAVGGRLAEPGGISKRIGKWEHMIRPIEFFLAPFARFNDNFSDYQIELARAVVAEAVVSSQIKKGWGKATEIEKVEPIYDNEKVIKLADDNWLMAMHGKFAGDIKKRSFLIRSLDKGMLWRYYATIASDNNEPNVPLAEDAKDFYEPVMTLSADGSLMCILRTEESSGEMGHLNICFSTDNGETWSKPKSTGLMGLSPRLCTLSDGIIACAYGLPGLHIAFSTDNGKTWKESISLSECNEEEITGRIDMIKVSDNKLLALAGAGKDGTFVYRITVERAEK